MLESIASWVRQLQLATGGSVPAGGDGPRAADLIDLVGALESLKSVASAAQAHWTAQFATAREAELASRPSRDADRGASIRRDIGAQIGLARRVSPRVGSRLVGLAKVLTTEMPSTMAALRSGRIDEYQSLLVVAETTTLSREHRAAVDAELASRFGTMSSAGARSEAARIGYRLDPEQAVRRARKAAGDRCVTLRPAPDTMTYLTALLPAVDGVAAYAALIRHAASATAQGDPRGRGALMADALVERLTAASTVDVPVDDLSAEPVATVGPVQVRSLAVGAGAAGPRVGVGVGPSSPTARTPAEASATAPPPADPKAIGHSHGYATATSHSHEQLDRADPDRANQYRDDPNRTDPDRADPNFSHRGGTDPCAVDADEQAVDLTDGMRGLPPGVHLEIQLLMTDRTLFGNDSEPALLAGYGAIPAPLARHLARGADPHSKVWVRRLYADDTGRITDADSRRRLFAHAARQVLVARDQVCRTPWCGAPIRHADHTSAYARGGTTAFANGAGRCVACNQVKESPGWNATTGADGSIATVTPTGHRYLSHPPPAPRSTPWIDDLVPTSRTA